MYKRCPECGYQRQSQDSGSSDICPGCGLVFSKWMRRRYQSQNNTVSPDSGKGSATSALQRITPLLFHIEGLVDPLHFWARAAAFLLFFLWGWHFIWMEIDGNAIGGSFMHNINLVFHEAGHILFIPLGDFMRVLGGSLLQVLFPLIVMGAFVWQQHNPFGGAVALWWAGQSMMDLAPYINDARAGQLMLIDGSTGRQNPWGHDWHNLLSRLDLLGHDHRLAALVELCGELTVLLALCWAAYILLLQYRQMRPM